MTKKQSKHTTAVGRLREILEGLLDRAKEEVQTLGDALFPTPKPALRPVPVRSPRRIRR